MLCTNTNEKVQLTMFSITGIIITTITAVVPMMCLSTGTGMPWACGSQRRTADRWRPPPPWVPALTLVVKLLCQGLLPAEPSCWLPFSYCFQVYPHKKLFCSLLARNLLCRRLGLLEPPERRDYRRAPHCSRSAFIWFKRQQHLSAIVYTILLHSCQVIAVGMIME